MRQNCLKRRRARQYGKVEGRFLIVSAVSALVLLMGAYVWFSSSPEDLLDREILTAEEIHTVATDLLRHEEFKTRAKAAEKLLACGDAAVPVLKEIGLSDAEAALRQAVLGILVSLDGDAAIAVATDMVNDADPEIRRGAVDAAAQMAHPEASRILARALNDEDANVRSFAAGVVGPHHAAQVVPKLQSLLDDSDPRVRRHARRSLKNMTGVDYPDPDAR